MIDDLDEVEERLTVLLAQGGDRDAFDRLVDAYDKRLLYFVRRILGETDGALDVLQWVWLTVYRRLGQLESPSAFRVWLYRIAHDQAVTELRKKTRQPVRFEKTASDPASDEAHDADVSLENAELVHVALGGLSVDHRRVLALRFLEDMTIDEIAKVIGCSDGTVKSRLHYAKIAVRHRIEELLHDWQARPRPSCIAARSARRAIE